MIKNLIFDIGGVILDECNINRKEFLKITKERLKEVDKIIYTDVSFKKCLLGEISNELCIDELITKNKKYEKEIKWLLDEENQEKNLPIKKDMLELLYKLKEKNYKIYFLSNLTPFAYAYVKDTVKLVDDFDGGLYSCIEHIKKPGKEIYELIIERYNLNKNQTNFFDNTLRNVNTGNDVGIKSVLFRDINDVIQNLEEEKI